MRRALLLVPLLAWLGPAGQAEEEAPQPVPLDALFKLPAGPGAAPPPPAGGEADREQWEERFRRQHRELEQARKGLADSQRELEELASDSDSWQITAPGATASPENTPLSYKLRQDIRRQREEVQSAERALRDLQVEASLAGVPAEWRDAPEEE